MGSKGTSFADCTCEAAASMVSDAAPSSVLRMPTGENCDREISLFTHQDGWGWGPQTHRTF